MIGVGLCLGAAHAGAQAAGAPPADLLRWRLDPTHSFVHFEVLHFGTATLRGRLGPAQGEVDWTPGTPRGRLQVRLPMTPSTGVPALDAMLRGPLGFAVEAYPEATLVAEQWSFDAAGQPSALRGELFLRGRSEPLTLSAQRFGCYRSPLLLRRVCGGDFEAELQRSRFGIDHSLPFVADRVRLLVQVEAVELRPGD